MPLSEQIAALRKRAGLSQEQLSEALGVSRQAVSKWESGGAMPELDKIVQLSRVLGVSTDALLLDELDCFSSIPPELTGSARPFPVSQGSGTGRAAAFGLMLAGLLCAVLGWREYQALLLRRPFPLHAVVFTLWPSGFWRLCPVRLQWTPLSFLSVI